MKQKYKWLFVFLVVGVAAFAVWRVDFGGEQQILGNIPVGETPLNDLPKTLDPTLFSGTAAMAYALAAQIPGTLAQIHCYCECDMESLFICYVSDHAANCDECQEEVFMAKDLLGKGYTMQQIQREIHKRFGGNP